MFKQIITFAFIALFCHSQLMANENQNEKPLKVVVEYEIFDNEENTLLGKASIISIANGLEKPFKVMREEKTGGQATETGMRVRLSLHLVEDSIEGVMSFEMIKIKDNDKNSMIRIPVIESQNFELKINEGKNTHKMDKYTIKTNVKRMTGH